jgi:hypothetical protein
MMPGAPPLPYPQSRVEFSLQPVADYCRTEDERRMLIALQDFAPQIWAALSRRNAKGRFLNQAVEWDSADGPFPPERQIWGFIFALRDICYSIPNLRSELIAENERRLAKRKFRQFAKLGREVLQMLHKKSLSDLFEVNVAAAAGNWNLAEERANKLKSKARDFAATDRTLDMCAELGFEIEEKRSRAPGPLAIQRRNDRESRQRDALAANFSNSG